MADNREIKDGLGNEFTLRTKDVGSGIQCAMSIPADGDGAEFLTHDNPGAFAEVYALVSANFNRPGNTNAYESGDLVANSTSAGSVVPMALAVARVSGGKGKITRGRLTKSNPSQTSASFRVHFFDASPGSSVGDNTAFASNGAASYLGYMDFDLQANAANAHAFSDGVTGIAVPAVGSFIVFSPAAQNIYALLEARAAYSPASSESFTLALEVIQN